MKKFPKRFGRPNRAQFCIEKYVKEHNESKLMRFINHYCAGLNEIERITDKSLRRRMRLLWRDDHLKNAEKFHKSHLPEHIYNCLISSIKTFFKEKERKDLYIDA